MEYILSIGACVLSFVFGVGLACWRLRDRTASCGSFKDNLRAVIQRTGGQGEER